MSNRKKNSQHNLKLIRRFNEDIFARLALKDKPSQVLNYIFESHQNNYKYRQLLRWKRLFWSKKNIKFAYKVVSEDKEFRRKKQTMRINNYLTLLKLRRFYGYLGKKKFKKVFSKKSLSSNFLGRSFVYFLETRLDVILYRANFFLSIYEARQFINHGKVYVNGILKDKPGFKVSINDIITLKDRNYLYLNMKKRLFMKKVLVNYPKYLEVNYKLASIILLRLPNNNEVPYPFFMDLNTISHSFLK